MTSREAQSLYPPTYPSDGTYADLVQWHLFVWGTKSEGSTTQRGAEPWDITKFKGKIFTEAGSKHETKEKQFAAWTGTSSDCYPPGVDNARAIAVALFNGKPQFEAWIANLESARRNSTESKKGNKATIDIAASLAELLAAGYAWNTAETDTAEQKDSTQPAVQFGSDTQELASSDAQSISTKETQYILLKTPISNAQESQTSSDKRLNFGPSTEVLSASVSRSLDRSPDFPLIFTPRLPPALQAEPDYIASHAFVGRSEQLALLDEWAKPSDPNAVLLLNAIGGMGKSFLAWHWINHCAPNGETTWVGRFWYSFYEPHASIHDFCCHLLSYMSGQPVDTFRHFHELDLRSIAIEQLRKAPWLVVLDGLERLLVHYQRIGSAYVDDANSGTEDLISSRDGCAVVRGEDAHFLRLLSSGAPSKILATTRNVPSCLLNPAGQTLPKVKIHNLGGLSPDDACSMMRASGVSGDMAALAEYLKRNLDCHPLVLGVLAGIINTYLPARGDFDAWVDALEGGRSFELGEVSLVQRHNDILDHAVKNLPPDCIQILSVLSLLSGSTDYETIAAIARTGFSADNMNDLEVSINFESDSELNRNRDENVMFRRFQKAITSLESFGLLQYERISKRYDVHPVVRARVVWQLLPPERRELAGVVVDHFTSASTKPFREAQTLSDITPGIEILHGLILMDDYPGALKFYRDELHDVVRLILDRQDVLLALIKPFFGNGWNELRVEVTSVDNHLFNNAGLAMNACGLCDEAYKAHQASLMQSLSGAPSSVVIDLLNLADTVSSLKQPRLACDTVNLALQLALAIDNSESIFISRLERFRFDIDSGDYASALGQWEILNPMGRDWSTDVYRQGEAEYEFARFLYYQNGLTEGVLAIAEQAASGVFSRWPRRNIARLRGMWRLGLGDWSGAYDALAAAVGLKSASRIAYDGPDIQLLRTKLSLGIISRDSVMLEVIEPVQPDAEIDLAELRFQMGDIEAAREHALRAMDWCISQGTQSPLAFDGARVITLLEKCS